jgi:hypothetical protein
MGTTYRYVLGAQFASAIVNSDYSGLSDLRVNNWISLFVNYLITITTKQNNTKILIW